MLKLKSIKEVRAWRNAFSTQRVGFVPTMGGLHNGHLDLLRKAREECDIVISSIYVNPAQFAAHEDIGTYPRTLEYDLEIMSKADVDAVFLPSNLYAVDHVCDVVPNGYDSSGEGMIRPHFFTGVLTVVCKLFNIVNPTTAYFGQKDAMQLTCVRKMQRDLDFPIDIQGVATARELDGLASSTRNAYLQENERKVAPKLYEALLAGKAFVDNKRKEQEMKENHSHGTDSSIMIAREEIESVVRDVLKDSFETIEYISVGDTASLVEVDMINAKEIATLDDIGVHSKGGILAAAVKLPSTRILDNVLL